MRTLYRATVAICVAFAMVASVLATAPDAMAGDDWTDHEIIEAVLFGTGPVAEAVDLPLEINFDSSASWIQHRQMADHVVDYMILTYTELMAEIADQLVSGNPYEVEASLEQLSPLLEEALVATGQMSQERLDNASDGDSQGCGWGFVCFVVAVAAVVVAVVVAGGAAHVAAAVSMAVAAVYLHTVTEAYSDYANYVFSAGGEDADLAAERFLADLTLALAQ